MQENQNVETTIRVLIATLRANARICLVRNLADEFIPSQPEERIVRRLEAARLLARTPRAVDLLAEQGHIQKVRLPGRKRNAGFRMSDLQALVAGSANRT